MSLDTSVFMPDASLPKEANTFSGELLVIGTARCVLDDLDHYEPQGDVMVVKQMGLFYHKIRHWWVSDTRDFPNWIKCRKESNRYWRYEISYLVHAKPGVTSQFPHLIDCWWPTNPKFAWSAGQDAAIAGVSLGYDKVVLAGLPGVGGEHFFPNLPCRVGPDYGDDNFKRIWVWLRDNFFEGKVKSLSGMTKEILGAP